MGVLLSINKVEDKRDFVKKLQEILGIEWTDTDDEEGKYNDNMGYQELKQEETEETELTQLDSNMETDIGPEELLKLWGMEQYTKALIDEHGWDDTKYWKDIEKEYLIKEVGFKAGHAHKFVQKAKGLFHH